jgi:hypothetical protein
VGQRFLPSSLSRKESHLHRQQTRSYRQYQHGYYRSPAFIGRVVASWSATMLPFIMGGLWVDGGPMASRTNTTAGPIDAFDQRSRCSRVETVGTGRCAEPRPRTRQGYAGHEKWSGRWESNPRGRCCRNYKTSGFLRMLIPSVISV